MTSGLYGKLPVKRDFVAENVPRGFIQRYEPWLQGSIAASRITLGPRWQAVYYAAPIWRFWLGPQVCGAGVVGAMMPSIDGVGRAFPLTVMTAAGDGAVFDRPENDPQDAWFEAVEDLLLTALDADCDYPGLLERLAGLPEPASIPRPAAPAGATAYADGLVAASGALGGKPPFEALRQAQDHADLETGVVWWTIGGERTPPTVLAGRVMPPADQYRGFLEGFVAAS